MSGAATYLSNDAGLIETVTYAASTTATATTAGSIAGRMTSSAIQHGELGAGVLQQSMTYFRKEVTGATLELPAASTVYRHADDTGGETTNYAFTFVGATAAVASQTVTYATVTTAQNGPNAAVSVTWVADGYGRVQWSKDGGGFIHYTAHDTATGAPTRSITNVDTTATTTFTNQPSGWTTPSGGGLHLTTEIAVDGLGRVVGITDAEARVTRIVYKDADHETRVYRDWRADGGNYAVTGPIHIMRENRALKFTEELSIFTTPAHSGGLPTGAESVASIQSLSRTHVNNAGQVVFRDDYYTNPGTAYTYSAATIGSAWTPTSSDYLNGIYYRSSLDYDNRGRLKREVTPAGTITRYEYDLRGLLTRVKVGTNDSTSDNMATVAEYQYDGGNDGGDGNLTLMTEYPGDGTANRVTQVWYDWRDRPVVVKGGVESSESATVNRPLSFVEYDNLNRVTVSELYDGDNVTIGFTAGVPNRPSSSFVVDPNC